MADGHACEPIVKCGVWSGCVWLDRIAPGRYRRRSGTEIYVRRKECWSPDGGPSQCAVHCTGADGGVPCFDGLHPEDEACKGTAAPTANSHRCLMGDGVCGSFM